MVTDHVSEHMGAEDEREGRLPLQRLAIPDQFAQVVAGIYRSSYPDVMHLSVFKVIGIKTIV
jgi:tyrosine-protein phosphatase SIW14